MDRSHEAHVSLIAAKVKQFFLAKKPYRIFHGSTNSTRVLSFKKSEMIDISNLNRILSINTKKRSAVVEPNVPMDKLLKETLKHGLIPPIVMEFPGITVGGGIQGNGGESSSFKWGCFNQTFNWYEIIEANGDVIKASSKQNSTIFYGITGTAGTLGIITSAEIKLIPAKKYVELTYTPVTSFVHALAVTKKAVAQNVDFIDGIMFSDISGVIISGTLTSQRNHKLQKFSRARDQWYYLHVEKTLCKNINGWSETVPIADYIFRYDRGAFWVGRFAFEMFNVPYNRFMRWLLNPILHTRKLYQALQESGASQQHVVQDIALPEKNAVKFLEFINTELNTYPLWLCPMLPEQKTPFQLNNIQTDLIINIGVWGANIPNHKEFLRLNRLVEKQVLALGGKKWSYAHSYFTKEEFWSMYDTKYYEKLRKQYNATYLPDIYDKLTVRTTVPIRRKKAVFRTLFGLAKLNVESK